MSLHKLTTLNLVLLLGSVPLFPTPVNVQNDFLTLREESWTHTLWIRLLLSTHKKRKIT